MDKVHKIVTELGHIKSLDDLVDIVGLAPSEASAFCDELARSTIKKSRKLQLSYPALTPEDSKVSSF